MFAGTGFYFYSALGKTSVTLQAVFTGRAALFSVLIAGCPGRPYHKTGSANTLIFFGVV